MLDVTQSSVSVVQVALTQEQASKMLGQLEAALVDLNSLPGMVRSAWFERSHVTAIWKLSVMRGTNYQLTWSHR